MTFMKSVNEKFWTWFENNERLGFVLIGAIGFPLLMVLGGALIMLVASTFMWFGLSTTASILITSLMVIGAIGGFLAYSWLDDND